MFLIYGLSSLVLLGFGVWILKRESGDIVRAVGYLLSALGTVLLVVAILTTLEMGMLGVW